MKKTRKLMAAFLATALTLSAFVALPLSAYAAPVTDQLDFTGATGDVEAFDDGYYWFNDTKTLLLNGINLSFSGSPGEAALLLPGGSTITLTGSNSIICDAEGAIQSVGSGNITVQQGSAPASLYLEAATSGISSDDGDIIINSGTIEVKSGIVGLLANGSVEIKNGAVTIAANREGISATGSVAISGGALDITAGAGWEGILSGGAITINGGRGVIKTLTTAAADSAWAVTTTDSSGITVGSGIFVKGWDADADAYSIPAAAASYYSSVWSNSFIIFVDEANPTTPLYNISFGADIAAVFTARNSVDLSSPTNLVFDADDASALAGLSFDSVQFMNVTAGTSYGKKLSSTDGLSYSQIAGTLTIPAAAFGQHTGLSDLTPGSYRAHIVLTDGINLIDFYADFTLTGTFNVSIDPAITNGSIAANPTSDYAGETITLTVLPDFAFGLSDITVYQTGNPSVTITVTPGTGNTCTFTMPAYDVTVTAVFIPVTVTATGIAVKPSAVTVQVGSTKQFSATVSGENNPPQSVTWTVAGGMAGTSIAPDGKLTIASGEKAASLTVTAVSTFDERVSGSATVRVTKPSAAEATASVGGGNEGVPKTADSRNILVWWLVMWASALGVLCLLLHRRLHQLKRS